MSLQFQEHLLKNVAVLGFFGFVLCFSVYLSDSQMMDCSTILKHWRKALKHVQVLPVYILL